ncbi:MAG: 4-alpha-glucanotransferase [Candidatus Omnitrophota bacterium]
MPQADLTEYLLQTKSKDKWQRLGVNKRAGVLAPLFSLYSKESIGIADFFDIKLLIDWCVHTGNSILQFLPMNEAGSLSCPYDAISSFALEPLYISLKGYSISRFEIKALKEKFPVGKQFIDYSIKKEKVDLVRKSYLSDKDQSLEALEEFKSKNSYWLTDFSLYKAIKARYKGLAWWDWEDKYRNHDKRALDEFYKENEDEINFQAWLQWQLFMQLCEVKEYAKRRGVLLKGDLPILVSRDSADVWAHPEFFKLEFAAGAPPDMYCAKGQRWGMPTYNWDAISRDDYKYLKEKLKYSQNFYDILRIDHVVGLFRIWSIPYGEPEENKGLNGFFDPGDEKKWPEQARGILSVMLENTDMLLCAEDLGVIPKVCPDTLKEFGILGNDVERWAKDWNVRHDFLRPQEYREISVAMLSTHDTTNWPAWWENEAGTVDEDLFIRKCADRHIDFSQARDKLFDMSLSCHGRLRWKNSMDSTEKLIGALGKKRGEVGDFIDLYENSYQEKEKLWELLNLSGTMREKSDKEIVREVFKATLGSRAAFCINTIFDYLYLSDALKGNPYQYRINTPGTISVGNWSLALPLSLEDLLKHRVNKEIRKLIADTNRI